MLRINSKEYYATLPTEIIGYIEFPITTVKPSQHGNIHLNILIHSVVHTFRPEVNEPTNAHYQDKEKINNPFEVRHFDLYKIQSLTILTVMYTKNSSTSISNFTII